MPRRGQLQSFDLMSALKDFAERFNRAQTELQQLQQQQDQTLAEAQQLREEVRFLRKRVEQFTLKIQDIQQEREKSAELVSFLLVLTERSRAIIADAAEITGDTEYASLLSDYDKRLPTEARAEANQEPARPAENNEPPSWLAKIDAGQKTAA